MKVVQELEESGEVSEPAKELSDWMGALILSTWTRLVELTADDVNLQWKRKSEGWLLDLQADPSPENYHRIFGRRGDYEDFRKTCLDPFFRFDPHPLPKESPGQARLEALFALPFEAGRDLALDWIGRHGLARGRVGWEPYPVSLRIQLARSSSSSVSTEKGAGGLAASQPTGTR